MTTVWVCPVRDIECGRRKANWCGEVRGCPAAPTTEPHCAVCARPPERMNSDRSECSHIACPHRRALTVDRSADLVRDADSNFTSHKEIPE